ncbi:MAG TPA: ABC transporter ATP-binding protein [Actinomycetes bacterium]|nr:ABC transporter ATP-binding protein [Actinomycetes bacterium]
MRRRGAPARAWLWPLARPHRGLVALGSLAVLTQSAAGLAMPYLVKVAIDQGVVPRRLEVLNRVAVAYVVLAGVQMLAGRLEILTVAAVGQRVLFAVRSKLFGHLQTLSLDFYERERTGRVVARMTNDIDAMSDLVTDGLVTFITSVITLAGIAVILVLLDWQLALATLTVAPLLALAATRFRRRSAAAWRRVRETASVVTVQLQEALSGVRAIQAFRRERTTAERFAGATGAERRAHQRTIALASLFFPGVEFAGTLASVIVLGVGGRQVLAGGLEIGTLAAFLLYLRSLFDPVQQLSELYDTFQSATAGAERVGAVLAMQPTVREAPDAVPLPAVRGEVRLEQVRFAYGVSPAQSGPAQSPATGQPEAPTIAPEVLHGVDLLVPAGRTMALVGPTGAGKSTVAKLIARFYDPLSGRVTLDGHDLRQVRLADLRRAMGYVPQEGFLFSSSDGGSATVADNIRFGRPGATRAEIEAAARAVGAGPVIAAMPKGFDTEVGERGVLLSAGERQLVSFARAWIADPALLILDEATSNLDVVTETRLQQALRRLRQGRTTIVIAHRLSTVVDADQVAIIEDGRVVEVGPPEDLIARGGRFAALYDRWLAGAA